MIRRSSRRAPPPPPPPPPAKKAATPKVTTAEDILKMAVGRTPADMKYDSNGDGKITSADALAFKRNEQQYEKSYSKLTPSASSEQQALNELAKKQAAEKTRTRTGQAGPPMPVFGNPFPPQTPAQKRQSEMELARKKAANPTPVKPPAQIGIGDFMRDQISGPGFRPPVTQPRPTPPTKPTANFAMKKGGKVKPKAKKYAKGGKIDGCAQRGKTKGRMV